MARTQLADPHKDKSTDDVWKLWKNKGYGEVLSECADLALLIRDRAMVVVDFDSCDDAMLFEESENFQEFPKTVKESTSKGFHYFFKGTEETREMKLSNIVRPFEEIDLDIITTHENNTGAMITIYTSINKEWINSIVDTKMLPMPSKLIEFYNEKVITKSKPVKLEDATPTEQPKIEFDLLKDIVDGLAPTRADGYNTWTAVCWAVNNIATDNGYKRKGYNLIHEFSKKSYKYDEDKVDDFIEKSGVREDGYGLGSLLMYLKEDNEIVFHKIQSKLNPVKQSQLNDYAFVEEPLFDFFDGKVRTYGILKTEFEKRHFKVMRPVMYVEELKNGDFYMRTSKDLREAFGNVWCVLAPDTKQERIERFLNLWLIDAKIRTFETIEFLPPPLPCPRETFNMWRGFAIERKDIESIGNIKPFLDHLSILVNHDEKCVDYLVKWFSHIIQYPGVLNGISECIVSAQGSGKNVFLDFFHKILGKELYYETANPVQDLWSRFSLGRKNRVLINIDETSGKDTYPHAEQIKNMLTSPNYNYEQKGVNPITLNNFNRVFFTSNNLNPAVKITEEERRNFIAKASDEKKGNKEYFDKLIAYFNDEANQKAVFDYHKSIDLSKVDWINDRPLTEIYRDIQETNIKIEIKFFKWLAETNKDETELRYTGMTLFEHYHEFLDKCKYPASFSMNNTAWGRCIKPYIDVFIKKTRSNSGVGYKIKIGDVRRWLIEKKYMMDFIIIDEDNDDY
jgi:hypothetical protein